MKRNQQYSGQQNSDRQTHQQNPGYSRRNNPSTSFDTEEQFEDRNQDHEYRLEQGSRSSYQNYDTQDYPNYGSEFNSPFGNRRTDNDWQQRSRDYGGQFNRNSEWQNQGGNYQSNQGYGRNQGRWNETNRGQEGDSWRPFDNQGNWGEGGRDNQFRRSWDDNRPGNNYGQHYPTQSSRYGGEQGYGNTQERYGGPQQGYGGSQGYGSSQQGYGGSQGYGSSQQGYGGSQGYGSSQQGYGGSQGYGSSQQGYGGSQQGYSGWQGYGGSQQRTYKGSGPKGYQRSDNRITEDINDQLTDDESIDASQIEVAVNGAEVVLSGTVNSKEAKRHAEDIAERVSGVKNVENRIRVSNETSRNTNEESQKLKSRENEDSTQGAISGSSITSSTATGKTKNS